MKENLKTKNMFFQKGAAAIVMTVLLLIVLLTIGLGVSVILLQQIKLSNQASQSVIAFYAADAGAEKCLFDIRINSAVTCSSGSLDNGAVYTVNYNGSDLITSLGKYRGTSRKVELSW